MATKVYNASEVFITFGAILIEGKGDGTFLTIEPNEDDFTFVPNTDGSGTRSATNNRSARMTVTVAQSAEVNDLLSTAHNLDRDTPGGVTAAFLVKDNLGTSLYAAETAWITRFPTSEFAKESGTREWVFETDVLVQTIGGLP